METPQATSTQLVKVLCVDCDHTLVVTDLLHESLLQYLLKSPWNILCLLAWLVRGRGFLKSELAKRSAIPFESLPYRGEVITYIRQQRDLGASVYLVTAANMDHAQGVALHTGLFEGVFASEGSVNLKGEKKAQFLLQRFGKGGFDYIGDAKADFPVWKYADKAVVAGRSPRFLSKVRKINPTATSISESRWDFMKWLHLIRIHQWAKNLIIFVPVIAAHQVFDSRYILLSAGAFLSMSLVASSTYIANDFFDLWNDRAHGRKSSRPLASGMVSMPAGAAMAFILASTGVAVALMLPRTVLPLLGLYVFITLLYSFWIKRVVLADAVVLAGLYTLRLTVGQAVTDIRLSVWLLAFAIFVFFSLALVKRFVELNELLSGAENKEIKGRGYQICDLPVISSLGVASGLVSVLVVILYINSQEVRILYENPLMLMLLSPLLLYWIGRIWILAYRKEVHGDPVLFALKDRVSYIIAGLSALVLVLATHLH